jgi:hypothetical protein
MDQSDSSEADSRLVSHGSSLHFKESKVHYSVHSRPPLDPILSQVKLVHNIKVVLGDTRLSHSVGRSEVSISQQSAERLP